MSATADMTVMIETETIETIGTVGAETTGTATSATATTTAERRIGGEMSGIRGMIETEMVVAGTTTTMTGEIVTRAAAVTTRTIVASPDEIGMTVIGMNETGSRSRLLRRRTCWTWVTPQSHPRLQQLLHPLRRVGVLSRAAASPTLAPVLRQVPRAVMASETS